jgi:hypothetical protein
MTELKQNLQHFVQVKPIRAAVVAGIFYGCSFPPFPFPLQLLGFLAIAIWVEILRGASSHRQALTYLFYGLLPANLVVSYWLTMATVGGGIAAIVAKAVVMTLMLFPFIGFVRAKSYLASTAQLFILTAAWVIAEGIDLFWDLSYPWLWVGNAWAELPALYQYISVTGVFGLSAWVVFSALVLHKWLFLTNSTAEQNTSPILLVSIILAPVICSVSMYYFTGKKDVSSLPENQLIHTLLVQPNHDSYAEYSGFSSYAEALDALIAQTDSAITTQTEIIYWPEMP